MANASKRSKDLLQLEHKDTSTSSLESALLVCKQNSEPQPQKPRPDGPLPKSQLLGKVKDFLGVISEANARLQLDAKDSSKNYDIEVLTGDESHVIEMDLMVGVADLHTPEAIAAAESASSGFRPVIPLASSSIGTESDESSEDSEENDGSGDEGYVSSDCNHSDTKKKLPVTESSNMRNDRSLKVRKRRSTTQQKIVELS